MKNACGNEFQVQFLLWPKGGSYLKSAQKKNFQRQWFFEITLLHSFHQGRTLCLKKKNANHLMMQV